MGFDPEHYRIVTEAMRGGEIIRLEGAQLDGAIFEGAHLEKAQLEGASLRGANLRGANLRGANLFQANLKGANFDEACLQAAILDQSQLDSIYQQTGVIVRSIGLGLSIGKRLSGNFDSDAMTKKSCRTSLKNANCNGAYFREASLRKIDFNNTELSNSCLSNANLSGSILDEVSLQDADLNGANLADASLRNANLKRAILVHAKLEDADLRASDLSMTNFANADLTGAYMGESNLVNARFHKTVLNKTNLSKAKGLNSIEHSAESLITFGTIVLSNNLPRCFLQGCGLPDSYIDYLPSLIGSLNPIDFYSCFISYSSVDKSFVTRLHNDLQAKGIRCWLDDHQIKPGDEIHASIDRGIKLWDKVILCVSKHSLQSGWVNEEIEKAIRVERNHKIKTGQKILKIIPLNLDDSFFDWDGEYADTLQDRHAANFTNWDKDNAKYEEQFNRLVEALNTAAEEEPPPQKLID